MSRLAKENPHPRDARINFQAEGHIYTIDGGRGYTGVTTWGGSHFPRFDADVIIAKMMNGKNWTKSKYFGMSVNAIKQQWSTSGAVASAMGTKLHDDIERTINGDKIDNTSVEYGYYLQFEKEKLTESRHYRTEWTIFDDLNKIAGTIDYAAMRPDGTIDLYDWKRSGEIKTDGWGRYATAPCLSHLPDANFWKYAIQLNIYRDILERCYDLKVNSMTIVCLHPDNESYQEFVVPRLANELEQMLAARAAKSVRKSKTFPGGAPAKTAGGKTGGVAERSL